MTGRTGAGARPQLRPRNDPAQYDDLAGEWWRPRGASASDWIAEQCLRGSLSRDGLGAALRPEGHEGYGSSPDVKAVGVFAFAASTPAWTP